MSLKRQGLHKIPRQIVLRVAWQSGSQTSMCGAVAAAMKGRPGGVHDNDGRKRSESCANGGAQRSQRRTTYARSRAERITGTDRAAYWCSADVGADGSLVVHGKPLPKHPYASEMGTP